MFTPTDHQVTVGNSVTTGLSLTVSDSAGAATDTNTSVVATAADTAPTVTDTSATVQPTASASATSFTPFAYTTIADPDAGATAATTIVLTVGGVTSDAAGLLSGTGLTKTGVGTYTLAAQATANEAAALQTLAFTPAQPGTAATVGVTLSVSDGVAPAVITAETIALVGGTATPRVDTFSQEAETVYNDTPQSSATNTYATTIDAVLNGTRVVYDRSFNLPYSDPQVQQAVAAAQAALADAGASAGTPVLAASNATTLNSQTSTAETGRSSATATTVTTAFGPRYIGPNVGVPLSTGSNPTGYFYASPGQLDVNTDDTTTTTVSRTVTTTSTNQLTQLYVVSGASSARPAITGTAANQPASDAATITPFARVTVTDTGAGQTETVTITQSVAANGTVTDPNAASDGSSTSGAVTTLSGTPAQVTADLDALVFTPTNHQVPPGSTVTTGFTLAITDAAGATAADATTSVVATAQETAPALGGTQSGQLITDRQTTQPFASVTLTDPDAGAIETTTITLFQNGKVVGVPSDAGGTLSGAGLTHTGAGTYTLAAASPAAEQAALRALVFTPTAGQAMVGTTLTTEATLTVSDGTLTATDDATTIGVVQTGTGSAVGDVHMVTLTGVAYGFQAVGDFTLVQATAPADSFDVQVRTGSYPGATSVVTQAAARLGPDAVDFRLDGGVTVNGIADTALDAAHPVQTLEGGTLTAVGGGAYSLAWASGEHLTVRTDGPNLDLQAALPSTDGPGAVQGLLGDLAPTGTSLALADGTALTGLDDASLARLAQSWAVGPASLLDGGTVALTPALLAVAAPAFVAAATPGAVLTGSLGRAAGSPGVVVAGSAAELSGDVVANFAAADMIDALGVAPGTPVTFTPTAAGGTLAIGTTTLTLDGPLPGTKPVTAADGNGGTIIRLG